MAIHVHALAIEHHDLLVQHDVFVRFDVRNLRLHALLEFAIEL